MIRHLSQTHEIVVASLAESAMELQEASPLESHCDKMIVEVVPPWVRWAQACRAFCAGQSASVAYFWSSRLQERIEEEARRKPFDVTVVHCAFVARYALKIPANFQVLDFGDLDSGKWFDYARHKPFPKNIAYGLEAKRLRSFEKYLADRHHHCTVTTYGELEEYGQLESRAPCTVVMNGVNLEYFANGSPLPSRSPCVVFVGRMDYFPNVQGIEYFVKWVFPRIRDAVPNVELKIVGSNPGKSVQELATVPGVTVTGHVPDVRPYLREATVAIAPLQIARGIQNKILEALAMGVPVVATPQAAKGVILKPGRDILVGDSPEEFANNVIALLQDETLRTRLSECGRDEVRKVNAWEESMIRLDEIFTQANLPDGTQTSHAAPASISTCSIAQS